MLIFVTDDWRMKATREAQRKVRIATGAMCRCRECYCCEESMKAIAKTKPEGGE